MGGIVSYKGVNRLDGASECLVYGLNKVNRVPVINELIQGIFYKY